MPEFTDTEVSRIVARFNAVAPDARCPLCGNTDLGVAAGIIPVQLKKRYPDIFNSPKGDTHFPCAPLVCKKCGNTFLINLIVLGELDDLVLIKWPEAR